MQCHLRSLGVSSICHQHTLVSSAGFWVLISLEKSFQVFQNGRQISPPVGYFSTRPMAPFRLGLDMQRQSRIGAFSLPSMSPEFLNRKLAN